MYVWLQMKHCGSINLWEVTAKPIHAAAPQMMNVVHGKGTIIINHSIWMRWKIAFLISCYILHYFHRINHAISLSPGCLSWKDEFRRLYFLTPWDGNINNNGSPKGQRPPPWIDNCIKDGCESNQYSPETIKTAHYGKVTCNTYIFFRHLWKINQ